MIAGYCDWFMELFVPVVIVQNNCFGFRFFDSHLKTAPSQVFCNVCVHVVYNKLFTVAGSRCRQNIECGNFKLLSCIQNKNY